MKPTEFIGNREEISLDNTLDHRNLSRLLKWTSVYRLECRLFVNLDRLEITSEFSVNRVPKRVRLTFTPLLDFLDQFVGGWLMVDEPLIVGVTKPIAERHLSSNTKFANINHI